MNDMSLTTAAKSEQLTADDLIGGPRTITVTAVKITPGDQPASLSFQGDNGKPYYPCKSMRRVLVHAWGPDASGYAGRSMTLYRDPDVTFGALKVGGIRISHLSHIEGKLVMALTATKGAKKAFTVQVLKSAAKQTMGAYVREKLGACQSRADVADLVGRDPVFLEHAQKEAVRDLVSARMESFPPDPPDEIDLPDAAEARELQPIGADFNDEVPF